MTLNGKSIAVYCGSRFGNDPEFRAVAAELGAGLARAGAMLIYGAGDRGLMGEVARGATGAGGAVLGVCPIHLAGREGIHHDATRTILVDTMHERKKVMFTNAHAFVALPGGPGTLDEIIEVLTWRQLGLHQKPTVILNTNGYWDGLLSVFDRIVEQGFMDSSFLSFFDVARTADQALALLAERLSKSTQ